MSHQEMNVVGHGTRFEKRALLILHDAADVGVKFIPDVVRQQRFPILRREDQMHQHLGERLRHGYALSGLGKIVDVIYPGRCSGLSQHAPLGPKQEYTMRSHPTGNRESESLLHRCRHFYLR